MSSPVSALATQNPNIMKPSKLRAPSKLPTPSSLKRPLTGVSQIENEPPNAKKSRLEVTRTTVTAVKRPTVGRPAAAATTRPGAVRPSASKPAGVKPAVSGQRAGLTTRPPAARAAPVTRPGRPTAGSKAPGASTRPGTRTTAAAPSAAKKSGAAAAAKPKRAAWDLKGRLADMEAAMAARSNANQSLEGRITENNNRIEYLESLNEQLKGTVEIKENLSHQAEETIRTLERKLRDADDEFATTERRLRREKEDLEMTVGSHKRQIEALEGDLTASRQECTGLKTSIASMTAAQAGMKAELSATKLQLEQSTEAGRQKDEKISALESQVAELLATIDQKESEIREHETVRRRLHNTVQELKGNIRVFCRVRPLIGDELVTGDDIQHIHFPDVEHKSVVLDRLSDVSLNESSMSSRGGRNAASHYEFDFDRVFEPTSTQADVFEEISQLVQSALDGYNVCIFAYGQTGSGKTYTMEGPETIDDTSVGMIPRAVEQIFLSASALEAKGWKYTLQASFLEIYNETIRDLLGAANSKLKHEVRKLDAKSNEVEVTNINIMEVASEKEVHKLLSKASQNRAVASTNCNERSSRSHSVFRLKLTGSNSLTGENCQGTLNLVDLAGSERLSASGSTGDRLRETQNINKSLSNLGKVILALANKESHIPYRNSKLTQVLQNSLGGNSKTLMFVNISPKEENFQESLCSLRFATQVNQCNIGTAQKKVK